MSASAAQARSQEDRNYFQSAAPPGPQRLAEMLEESAFWTLALQRASAKFMWMFCVFLIILCIAAIFAIVPHASGDQAMIYTRVICAVLIFIVSTDMVGAARGYTDTAHTLDRLLLRFESIKRAGFPEPDMFMFLSNYNATVEHTPLTLPFIYKMKRNKLNSVWAKRMAS